MAIQDIKNQLDSMVFNGKKCAIRVWVEDEIPRKPLYEGVFASFEELCAFIEGPEGSGPDIPSNECGFEKIAYALVELEDGVPVEVPLVKTLEEEFDYWCELSDELIEQIVLDYLAAAKGEEPVETLLSEVIENCNNWMDSEDAEPVVDRMLKVASGFNSKGYKVKKIWVTPCDDMAISFAKPYELSEVLPEGFFHSKALDAIIYQFGCYLETDATEEELLDSLIAWIETLPEAR